MALIDNLIAYWPFDSNSEDAHATHDGADTSISYGAGKLSNAASFNGSSSKIIIPDDPSLQPTDEYSIFGWMKRASSTDLQILFNSFNYDPGGGNAGISFGIHTAADNEHKLTLIQGDNTPSGYAKVDGATVVDDDVWHLVGAIYDGADVKIYVDNVEDGSQSYSTNPVYLATNYVRFGQNRQEAAVEGKWYGGALDGWGLWSRALTSDERSLLWNSGNGRDYPFGAKPRNAIFAGANF